KEFNSTYIINTTKNKEDFKDLNKSKEIYTVDGSSISQELIKINNPSTVLIGVLIKITNIVTLESVKNIIKKEFEKKGKLEVIEPNIKCLEKGYNY
ncbi:MAG: 2-oxoacid:acceptor oxidoreductase family protein, partial [Acholeplasmataceae bacterium]|nr:2-oxoacid:acceptor oxidoreductase family protein [Acholeplasmataceae bacterium]